MQRSLTWVLGSVWSLTLGVAAGAGDEFHSFRLNGPLSRDLLGDVHDARLSPDGAWIVYSAVQSLSDGLEVYSAPASGGQAIRLSNHSTSVSSFRITPDGSRVVYLSTNLYSVPIDGSQAPKKLNGTLPGGGSITSFALSPDSSRVVYGGDARVDNAFELFSAPIATSGAALVLNDPLLGSGPVSEFAITPDSSRVVYLATQAAPREVFSVPIDRSQPPLRLNPAFPAGRKASALLLAPLGDAVFYIADQDTAGTDELYRAPLAGGPTLKVNAVLPLFQEVVGVRVSPDGTQALYQLTPDFNGRSALLSTSALGGQPAVQLTARLTSLSALEITPDSSRVIYLADQAAFFVDELYSVPIGGGVATQLNGALVSNGDVQGFVLTPDGQRVVYRADEVTDGVSELFGVPATGGVVSQLSAPLALSVGVQSDFSLTPAGTQVLFRADPFIAGGLELLVVPADGSAQPLALTQGADGLRNVQPGFDPGSQLAVFRSDLATNEAFELYRVPLNGGASPARVNPALPIGNVVGDVDSFLVAPHSSRVVYGANQQPGDQRETFSVLRDGGAPVRLDDLSNADSSLPLLVTPDGLRVILYDNRDLFSAPTDGRTLPLRLTGPSTQANRVESGALLSSDGAHVVYLSQGRLHSVPTDGSQPALLLDSPAIQGNGVERMDGRVELSPDGTRVVFLVDQQLTSGLDRLELFSALLDGSQPVQRLHPAQPSNRGVTHFAVSPDSSRVVFCANLDSLLEFELYSAPIDGSQPPLEFSAARNAGGLISVAETRQLFQITPDGTGVVFLSYRIDHDAYELYAAPLDASQGPLRLSSSLVAGGDVLVAEPVFDQGQLAIASRFQIAPDGQRVVYIADQRVNETFELFSAALPQWKPKLRRVGGPPSPVRLNAPLPVGLDIAQFEITPDSASVVFPAGTLWLVPITGGAAADLTPTFQGGDFASPFVFSPEGSALVFRAYQGAQANLYHARLDRSRPVLRVNDALVPFGEVRPDFRFSPDGEWVFYRADQAADEVIELFGATSRRLRPAPPLR